MTRPRFALWRLMAAVALAGLLAGAIDLSRRPRPLAFSKGVVRSYVVEDVPGPGGCFSPPAPPPGRE